MSDPKHKDYATEVERLVYTREYIRKTLDATAEYRKKYKENIKDAMINLDYLDSSQSYISVLINTKFIEMADRNFDSLTRAEKKPYFARIDFQAEESNQIDQFYIGKTSLFRAEDSVPLIVDWRSPVANVYYESRLGKTTYQVEGAVLKGELFLKRQYNIEAGQLKEILDIDMTTNDAFLQASLEANAEKRLKDIASTIQAEQNRIIRADMAKPLIVQGVAGSGKTTIALHRIAYFIYTYEKTFDPETFMIMAPNRLFLNYISEVLPELGVERVRQTTFVDFMGELIGNQYELIDPGNKLMTLIQGPSDQESIARQDLMKWLTAFKGSMQLKNIIDRYLKAVENSFCPEKDFSLDGHVMMTAQEVKHMFINELGYLPLYKRSSEVKKTLSNRLKILKKQVLKNTEARFDQAIEDLRNTMEKTEERRLKIIDLIDRRDQKLKELKNQSKTLIKKYLDQFPKRELFDYFSQLMTQEACMSRYTENQLSEEEITYLCRTTSGFLSQRKIELEDYAPLVYLKYRLFGFEKKLEISSIFIDEAQDFSLFQFYVLKEILNTNMITLLGDTAQGIHSYRGIQSWEEVIQQVFGEKKCNYMTLTQSYRTTIQVMELANQVIKKLQDEKLILAEPVIRNGQKPQLKAFENTPDLLIHLQKKLLQVQQEGYKSIAVVCKTKKECEHVRHFLEQQKVVSAKLLDEGEEAYEAGIVLVPCQLTKGLEFDAVLIVNLEEDYREEALDIKLLYVAMTRSLHRLYVYHRIGKMNILKHIGNQYLERQ